MNLEDVFCEIKTDCCNIAHGWLPLLVIFDDHHLGTSMPPGGHPPHQLAASSFRFSAASKASRIFLIKSPPTAASKSGTLIPTRIASSLHIVASHSASRAFSASGKQSLSYDAGTRKPRPSERKCRDVSRFGPR